MTSWPRSKDEETAFSLWGAILDGIDVDLRLGDVFLRMRVPHAMGETAVVIECHGVRSIEFATDIPWPWAYAEVTEVWAAEVDDGVRLDLTLWVEPNQLSVVAETILIGGDKLQPPFNSVAREARVTSADAD